MRVHATNDMRISAEPTIQPNKFFVYVRGVGRVGLIVKRDDKFSYWPNNLKSNCDGNQHDSLQACLDFIA